MVENSQTIDQNEDEHDTNNGSTKKSFAKYDNKKAATNVSIYLSIT